MRGMSLCNTGASDNTVRYCELSNGHNQKIHYREGEKGDIPTHLAKLVLSELNFTFPLAEFNFSFSPFLPPTSV